MGAGGSYAFAKGAKFLKDNPQFKNAVADELKEALKSGWQSASKKYPLLNTITEPKYIIKNENGAKIQAKSLLKQGMEELEAREKLAIKGVIYEGKKAALIYKDLENIDNAVKLRKGYHNDKTSGGYGANHINAHLEPQREGFLSESEVLDLGQKVRAYLKEFGEPFIDKKGARIYEWFDENGTKFRVVVDDIDRKRSGGALQGTTSQTRSTSDEEIITYFSNRFSDKDINFKNKKVEKAYEGYLEDKASFYVKESNEIEKKMKLNAPRYEDLDIYDIQYKLPLRYLYDRADDNFIAREILQNYETGFEGRGYSNYSMSNNAVSAYEHGQKPLSKFTSEDAKELSDLLGEKWSVKEVKDFVEEYGEAGYHHTSKHYNKTNFYSLAKAMRNIAENDEEYLKKLIKKMPPPEQSQKEIEDFLSYVESQDELRKQLNKELEQTDNKVLHFRLKLQRHQYIKERDEQLKIERQREKEKAAYKKAFEAKKPLAKDFMEYLEKIGWYQNAEKHAQNKEKDLNYELEKALKIYEWLKDKTYLKSLDELKAEGFSGADRYHLGRLKHFEKDLTKF